MRPVGGSNHTNPDRDEQRSKPPRRDLSEIYDPLLAAELRRIELRTRRNISTDLMGNYRSAFRGTGLVFSDLREYQPGDDVKKIHWRASARSGRVYVKSYEEDRQLNVFMVVDISRSTDLGSTKTKHLRALELAAFVSILADKNHDSIGLCLFSDEVEEFLPPGQTKNQLHHVLFRLLAHRDLRPGTDVRGALEYLNKHARRPSVMFLVSDFLCEPFEEPLRLLAARHDVVCVLLEDPMDTSLPLAGIVEFIDAETGERCLLDTSSAGCRELLASAHEQRVSDLQSMAKRLGVDFMRISENPLRPLGELMRRRANRIR